MIRKLEKTELHKYLDFAYDLSQDLSKSSFPTYVDTIKTKEDFYRVSSSSFDEDNSEVLLFEYNNAICGWIHYYWLDEDEYIGIKVFNVLSGFDVAIYEFLSYISTTYKGYKLYFGIPRVNEEALKHLNVLGNIVEEKSVLVLNFDSYEYQKEADEVEKITADNYCDFRNLHDVHCDMYWNSDRLYEAVLAKTKNPWHIYGLYKKGEIVAAIYFTYLKGMAEIFGIDYKDNLYDAQLAEKLLMTSFNKMKVEGQKYLTYFADGEEVKVLCKLGLQYITDYVLYVLDVV